jgi:hypothetical protein
LHGQSSMLSITVYENLTIHVIKTKYYKYDSEKIYCAVFIGLVQLFIGLLHYWVDTSTGGQLIPQGIICTDMAY